MTRVAQHVVDFAGLDDLPAPHHVYALDDLTHDRQVMRAVKTLAERR